MNESKTFFDESFMNRKIYYEVHENGLIYRPDSDEKFSLNWRDIQYIEDRSGDRVDIFLHGYLQSSSEKNSEIGSISHLA